MTVSFVGTAPLAAFTGWTEPQPGSRHASRILRLREPVARLDISVAADAAERHSSEDEVWQSSGAAPAPDCRVSPFASGRRAVLRPRVAGGKPERYGTHVLGLVRRFRCPYSAQSAAVMPSA